MTLLFSAPKPFSGNWKFRPMNAAMPNFRSLRAFPAQQTFFLISKTLTITKPCGTESSCGREKKMPENQQSIVQAIQEMIRDGQSENAILQNLKELGVPKEKAQKLLLLSQSDVLPVLQTEISRLVDKKMDDKKIDIIRNLQNDLKLVEEKTTSELKEKNEQDLKTFEKYLETRFAIVQSQVNESAKKALDTSERVREKAVANENRIRQLEIEGTGNKETQILEHK